MAAIIKIANYLSETKLEEISSNTLTSIRYCLLDALGCGLLGSITPEAHQIVSSLKDFYQPAGSPVWGTPYNFSPDNTAFICGAFCHMRELDDVHYSIVHPGSVCVPASYAVAHLKQLKMGDLMLSILCGVEAMIKISKGINYIEHRKRGWHGTATCGSFGSAASVGKLFDFNREQMCNALALAGSRTGGTWAFSVDGAMSKRLHPGLAARDGVLSAYLAAQNITGPKYILEAEDGGFYNATSFDWDLKKVEDHKEDSWGINEVEYKWYASCKSVHSPLEAARQIYYKINKKNIEDISEVSVEVNNSAFKMAGRMYNPKSVISAQLSIPYGIALGLMGRDGGAEDYTFELLEDDKIFELASKIQVKSSKKFDDLRSETNKSGAKVTVIWKDGTIYQSEVDSPKGSLENPLSGEDIENKFIKLASLVIGIEKSFQLKDIILEAPDSFPVTEISKLLKVEGKNLK